MIIPTVFSSSNVGEDEGSETTMRSDGVMEGPQALHSASKQIPASRFYVPSHLEKVDEEETASIEESFYPPLRKHPGRDIPIYAPRDSPHVEHAYFLSNSPPPSSLSPPSPKPFIVNDYELTDATSDEDCCDQDIDMREIYQSSWESSSSDQWRTSCDSDLALQIEAGMKDIFQDEAAWLRSPLSKWNGRRSECLPYILSQSMPMHRRVRAWVSDTNSWVSEGGEDILACATALAPSKAQVVEVNRHKPAGLSISIPPRSSSLGTTFPDFDKSALRSSWMTFGEMSPNTEYSSVVDQEIPDILDVPSRPATATKPTPNPNFFNCFDSLPVSPTSLSEDSLSVHEDPQCQAPTPSHDSLHGILSELENHMGAFPSRMLLEESNCISAIRSYLRLPKRSFPCARPRFEAPLSPALSQDTVHISLQREFGDNYFVPTSHQTGDSATTRYEKPQGSSLGPDLEPLRRVFPDTSNFMRSALYAHLLAYIFITSLNTSNPSTPTQNTFSFRPTSRSIPSKAAELLGMTEKERLSTEISIPSATKAMEDLLIGHIGTLVREMERSFEVAVVGPRGYPRISRTVLISLVEIVRGSEGA